MINQSTINAIFEEIENMSTEEFELRLQDAECGDLRWALEYGWNPDLDEFAYWKTCLKHMWE